MTAFVLLQRREDGRALGAAHSGGAARVWRLSEDDDGALPVAVREMARYLREAECIVTYEAGPLVELLSHPRTLPAARRCLGHLADAQEAALLVAAELADFSLEAFCSAHGISIPSVAEPEAFGASWEMLCRRLRERARALPGALRDFLSSVAGPAWPEAVLGPVGDAPGAGSVVASLLPRRPRRMRREAGVTPSGLQELATSALLPQGPVAREHPAYEHRPGQVQMAEAVAGALQRDEILLVEAGTGVGKSLAYLIPAAAFAHARGVPVIVSTNTRNLQDQLIERDIPLTRRSLGFDFEAAVLKGRANYVCARRLAAAAEHARETVFRDERLAIAHLIAWAAAAEIADVSALSAAAHDITPGLRQAVSLVRARAEGCFGRNCPSFQVCPVEVARARAQNADIVVANHALLLASANTSVLPEHQHVVLDEAHNIEDVATDQLGLEVSDGSVRRLVRLLSGEGGEPVHERAAEWLACAPDADDVVVHEVKTLLDEPAATLEYGLEDLAAAVFSFVEHTYRDGPGEPGRASVRLTGEVRETRAWQPVVGELPNVCEAAAGVDRVLARLAETVMDAVRELDGAAAELLLDIEPMRGMIAELGRALTVIVGNETDSDYVCWVETWPRPSGDLGWCLRAAPVDVGPALAETVYREDATVVMTSATLTVEGSFDYLRQRIGLDSEAHRLLELNVPSPFDFGEQLLMCVPTDLPLPGDPGFEQASSDAVFAAATAARGGTLCLFTSRRSMTGAFESLAERLQEQSLAPLCQDVSGERTDLLNRLREDEGAVLFGLKSFWEGVDVPGEALRCLVMVKLPFAVPSDPIIEARQERVEEQGLDGYNAYYVPNAIIGFRQGIGRLIRTRMDRGAVLILDRRLLLRRYGRRFLASAPPACRVMCEPLAECAGAIRQMLRTRDRLPHSPPTPSETEG